MVEQIFGPVIDLTFAANEVTNPFIYNLPDGYSINKLYIPYITNIHSISPGVIVTNKETIIYPVINSKSPSQLRIIVTDATKEARIRFVIEKFGQIPDHHYFDKAFEPILVTGEDGNEYNVIPSDQFK